MKRPIKPTPPRKPSDLWTKPTRECHIDILSYFYQWNDPSLIKDRMGDLKNSNHRTLQEEEELVELYDHTEDKWSKPSISQLLSLIPVGIDYSKIYLDIESSCDHNQIYPSATLVYVENVDPVKEKVKHDKEMLAFTKAMKEYNIQKKSYDKDIEEYRSMKKLDGLNKKKQKLEKELKKVNEKIV